MTAQRPRDRLLRLRLAAYEPQAAEQSGDGARHRAHEGDQGRRHLTWAIRPVVLARVGLVVVVLGAAAAAVVLLTGMLGSPPAPERPAATLASPRAAPVATADGAASPSETPVATAQVVLVHVAGAVAAPGLVQLHPGDRVADAIEAAGGPTADAELDRINLAAPVADGQQVYVPAAGETPPPAPQPTGAAGQTGTDGGSAVVNVNTATSEQLQTLPGIGPARAADIIDYRERDGPFQSVEELLQVPGIGPATLDRLRDQVRL